MSDAVLIGEQLELEAGRMFDPIGDDEAREGIGAFFARRAPQYAALRRGTDPAP